MLSESNSGNSRDGRSSETRGVETRGVKSLAVKTTLKGAASGPRDWSEKLIKFAGKALDKQVVKVLSKNLGFVTDAIDGVPRIPNLAEYVVKEKLPYVLRLLGHGNAMVVSDAVATLVSAVMFQVSKRMYFMEEEKLKMRTDQLESEVMRLKELAMILAGNVQYRNDKPYWVYPAQSMTYGEKEIKFSLIFIGICRRLEGEEQPIKPKKLCENNSYIRETYSSEPTTGKEIIGLLA